MMESLIKRYAKIMKELGLTGLEIPVENDKKLRIEMTNNQNDCFGKGELNEVNSVQCTKNGNYFSVKSPIVGVFYSGPAENAEPFVTVNDRIERGTTLCIIESMKLMNEILAEESGIVDEICVKNGQLVEYGTELFRIKR